MVNENEKTNLMQQTIISDQNLGNLEAQNSKFVVAEI